MAVIAIWYCRRARPAKVLFPSDAYTRNGGKAEFVQVGPFRVAGANRVGTGRSH
jgi:hypothetical protein